MPEPEPNPKRHKPEPSDPFLPTQQPKTSSSASSSSSSSSSSSHSPLSSLSSSLVKHLLCPITAELPFDPVTAEDGFVYDRRAIESYIRSRAPASEAGPITTVLRSPMTNQVMGTNLLAAPQVKNVLDTLVRRGDIEEGLLHNWNERMKEKELMKSAHQGDLSAMLSLANSYLDGTPLLYQDKKEAYHWFKKAHDVGNVVATAHIGHILCEGAHNLPKNQAQGVMYLGMAMVGGSDLAAFTLGMAISKGAYGLTIDKAEAIRCLQKALAPNTTNADLLTLRNEDKDCARLKLQQLQNTRNDHPRPGNLHPLPPSPTYPSSRLQRLQTAREMVSQAFHADRDSHIANQGAWRTRRRSYRYMGFEWEGDMARDSTYVSDQLYREWDRIFNEMYRDYREND